MSCNCASIATLRDNDEWKGLYRCKECYALFEETFEEDRIVGIPVLQKWMTTI